MGKSNLGGRRLSQLEEELVHNPLTVIDLYEEIREGTRKKFPNGIIRDNENCKKLVKYLIEDILKMDLEKIPQGIKKNHFYENNLRGVINKYYGGSPFEAIVDAYNNELPWNEKETILKPYYFQNIQNIWTNKDGTKNYKLARKAIKEFIPILMKKYGWTWEDLPREMSYSNFKEALLPFGAKIEGIIHMVYEGSPAKAIIDAYPTLDINRKKIVLKKYYFNKLRNIWNNQDGTKNYALAREAIREFIPLLMKKHRWTWANLPKKLTSNCFKEDILPLGTNLNGMMQGIYGSSPSEALIDTYKSFNINGKEIPLKPYYFNKVQNIWKNKDGTKNYKLAREMTHELVEVLTAREDWTLSKTLSNITVKHFKERILPFNTNLKSMIHEIYGSSINAALKDSYPEHYK